MSGDRSDFVEEQAKKLQDEWLDSAMTMAELTKKAILMGMNNSHLKDDIYMFDVAKVCYSNLCTLYKFQIYKNIAVIATSDFIFTNRETAENAAKTLMRYIEGNQND